MCHIPGPAGGANSIPLDHLAGFLRGGKGRGKWRKRRAVGEENLPMHVLPTVDRDWRQ